MKKKVAKPVRITENGAYEWNKAVAVACLAQLKSGKNPKLQMGGTK